MKEDLAIARNSLMALQAENLALRRNAQNGAGSTNQNVNNVFDHIDPEMAEALAAEKKKRNDFERELELQVIFVCCCRYGRETDLHIFFLNSDIVESRNRYGNEITRKRYSRETRHNHFVATTT